MVLMKYVGDIYPTRVKARNSVFMIEKPGDVIEVPDNVVDNLLLNGNFKLEGSETKKITKEKKEVEKVNYDLNGDGIVDKKDASIAGKVLYKTSKHK